MCVFLRNLCVILLKIDSMCKKTNKKRGKVTWYFDVAHTHTHTHNDFRMGNGKSVAVEYEGANRGL